MNVQSSPVGVVQAPPHRATYYLAGPMRGYDAFNFPAFMLADDLLTAQGYKIHNPARHDLATFPDFDPQSNTLDGFQMEGAIQWDLERIIDEETDGVIVLPGWAQSSGSQIEVRLCRLLGKPVYEYTVDDDNTPVLAELHHGHPEFHKLLADIAALHDRKQADYGTDGDPFANVRASEAWGIPPWVGALVRLSDKIKRLQTFAAKGVLANESAEDSMLDIAVYALISLILYREESSANRVS